MNEKKRKMNIILDVCKYRKNKNAIQCFNDDCDQIKEEKIFSTRKRRRGDGSMETKETDTGNIAIWCDEHNWKELFSVSQLEVGRMPDRTTKVNESNNQLVDPSGEIIER